MSEIRPLIVAISGGSGSGKTTFAKLLQSALGDHKSSILGQDSYYIDQSQNFDKDGGKVNFDHPSAIDFELMASHLQSLKKGQAVEVPIYDFKEHKRQKETITFNVKPIILVDGILILSSKVLLPHFDYKVFIDTPESLRFERRLKRDVLERGRTPEGVKAQFYNQVKPMHDEFVEPSKKSADVLVSVDDFQKYVNVVAKTISEP